MENDPFGRTNPEASSDNESDDDSSPKKKKKSRRLPLFDSSSEKNDKPETEEPKKSEPSPEAPLWKRILGQPEEEKPGTPEEEDEAESDEPSEEMGEGTEELENLSEDEQREVAEAYITARQAELMAEQAEASEADDEQIVQERTADIALLENIRRFFARERTSEQPLDAPVEEAYHATVEELALSEPTPPSPPNERAPLEHEDLPLPPVVTPLRNEYEPVRRSEVFPAAVPTETINKESDVAENDDRRRVGSALLVGGLVGYAIGRRRGRIKTEKQLKVVEQKLTKQVEAVQQLVVQKEQQIRTLAREASQSKMLSEVRPFSEKTPPKIEKKPMAPTELLGLMTIKAVEAPVAAETKQPPKSPVAEKPKKIESLSRPELLAAAAEVQVGATNLRRVYETNLISEVGLRRLLEENERGNSNIRASLEREIIEKEMSFERDPRLRNSSVVGSLAAGKVVRADIDKQPPVMDTPAPQASDAVSQPITKPTSRTATQSPQTMAVFGVITLVVIIAVLLVILFTSR